MQNEFKKEFGIIPDFTASINSGKIMVSEVGSLKSEIAFHGDVLNTAARIQKQCKSYKRKLLVTKNFTEQFGKVSDGFKIEWIAKDLLIGKKHQVDIFAIDRITSYNVCYTKLLRSIAGGARRLERLMQHPASEVERRSHDPLKETCAG